MSVRTNQYIMHGIKLPYKKDLDPDVWFGRLEPYLDKGQSPEIKHHKGLAAVSDGMHGQWEFIGRIVAKSEIDQTLEGPFKLVPCPVETAEMIASLINANFEELTADGLDYEAVDIQTYFFTHYH